MKPQVPVTRVHSRCGCICPPASLWDHALLERGIPSGVLTCQRADHALIHTARCCQPSLARRRSLRNCVNRLCDVRRAPTNSMLQMTQGSTRHRVLLLGEARALASISFCHTSQDHWKKSGDGGWRGGAGSCPQFSVLAAEHTYCAESLVSSQTSSHYAVVRWVPKG